MTLCCRQCHIVNSLYPENDKYEPVKSLLFKTLVSLCCSDLQVLDLMCEHARFNIMMTVWNFHDILDQISSLYFLLLILILIVHSLGIKHCQFN